MTSGERMVWAAEFVRVRALPSGPNTPRYAAGCAARQVTELRELTANSAALDDDTRAMLDDMLSTGGDR